MARDLSGRSLRSFAWSKNLFRCSHQTSLEAQLEQERLALVTCAGDPEGREGLQAFIDKRKPDFRRARLVLVAPDL